MFKIIIKKIIFFTIILSISSSAIASYKSLFEPYVPNSINVKISNKKNIIDYSKILYEVNLDKSPIINPKFKKYIKTKINFKIDNTDYFYDAEARIIGDWKDHIDVINNRSSLQIKINNGSIGGITRFRLYLPHTRNGENEIVWSIFNEILGYPTLYRKLIDVNFNGISYKALFEEIPNKEFLERWSIRETAIIEYDERQIWEDRYFSKVKDNYSSYGNTYKIDNSSFLKNHNSFLISLKSVSIKNNPIIENFDLYNAKVAKHGLVTHNRKFIYDPIYDIHTPLYYDGMVNIDQLSSCSDTSGKWEKTDTHNKILFSKFKHIFKIRAQKKLNTKQKCFVKKKLLENNGDFAFLFNKAIQNEEQSKYDNENQNPEYKPKLFGFDNGKKIFCIKKDKSDEVCEPVKKKNIKKYLSGKTKDISKINEYTIYPIVYGYFEQKHEIRRQYFQLEEFIEKKIFIPKNNLFFLKINLDGEKKRKIDIILENAETSRLVIWDSRLDNLELKISNKYNNIINNRNNLRYDENLLTGCLTIIDSFIYNSEITSSNSLCEDSVNFVRTKGWVKKINITNAIQDAVDVDFSNIIFEKMIVKNAGNDCLDLSAGNYKIIEAILKNCKDKAISVGERSFVSLDKADISKSKFGIVGKDSSFIFLNEINISSKKRCVSSLKKKNEYGGGNVNYVNLNCQKSINKKDQFSKLNKIDIGEFCKYVKEIYSGNICITQNNIKLFSNNNRFIFAESIQIVLNKKLASKKTQIFNLKNCDLRLINNCEIFSFDKNFLDIKTIDIKFFIDKKIINEINLAI